MVKKHGGALVNHVIIIVVVRLKIFVNFALTFAFFELDLDFSKCIRI